MPGLSYQYPGLPPEQIGLSVDADALQAVTMVQPDDFDAAEYLPESVVFELLPDAQVLVLDAGGGLGVLQALAGGAQNVTVVLNNALIPQAVAYASPNFNIYAQSNMKTIIESERIYLQQEDELFDIIFLPLTDAFRPVSSGAYSLSENDLLTVESFRKILSRLKPGGVFIFTRWMQLPPSESIRAIAILVEAIEQTGIFEPRDVIVVYRGIQTVTVMIRSTGWTSEDLAAVRKFAQDRKYDLVWVPDIQEDEINLFNRLPEPVYYLTVREILTSQDRDTFYKNYPYDISPPTDNKPFFYHFFKWEQTPEVLASLGHTWQPFGGSGYFVLVALLASAILLSFGMILFPVIWQHKQDRFSEVGKSEVLIYFGLLGVAFLFIEIPLIQYWIMLLGHPTYAFTVVVAVLLVFSGIGSAFAKAPWLPRRTVFVFLLVIAFVLPFSVQQLSGFLLSLPLWGRLVFSVFSLAPMGILMGLPFPLGIAWLQAKSRIGIPLAWAVNGCASVIASVLAAMISLSYGYAIVLLLGASAYACAAILYLHMIKAQ
jgi:SAM-dependent methyltransferase